jgi:hypothetical protein
MQRDTKKRHNVEASKTSTANIQSTVELQSQPHHDRIERNSTGVVQAIRIQTTIHAITQCSQTMKQTRLTQERRQARQLQSTTIKLKSHYPIRIGGTFKQLLYNKQSTQVA